MKIYKNLFSIILAFLLSFLTLNFDISCVRIYSNTYYDKIQIIKKYFELNHESQIFINNYLEYYFEDNNINNLDKNDYFIKYELYNLYNELIKIKNKKNKKIFINYDNNLKEFKIILIKDNEYINSKFKINFF